MWMWLLDSTTQSGKVSCPATTRNAANRSSGGTPRVIDLVHVLPVSSLPQSWLSRFCSLQNPWSGLPSGCRMVSTRAARSSRPGSTSSAFLETG